MAGRGRGRIIRLINEKEAESRNVSLDDSIRSRYIESGTRNIDTIDCARSRDTIVSTPEKSSDRRNYSVEAKGTLGARNTQGQVREYNNDVFKSLDVVIDERGIQKPPKQKRDDNGPLDYPITGRIGGVRIPSFLTTAPKAQRPDPMLTVLDDMIKTKQLDPMAHSLDEIIKKASAKGDSPASLSDRTVRTFNGKNHTNLDYLKDPLQTSLDDLINASTSSDRNVRTSKLDSSPKNIDPLAHSLQEIIAKRMEDIGEDGAGHSKKRGRDPLDETGSARKDGRGKRLSLTPKFACTPYRAASFLNEKGMCIFIKQGLKVIENEDEENSLRKWRCIVQCGEVMGVADSLRKVVAREMACDRFLKNLKKTFPGGQIPQYEIQGDLFLDPKVVEKVEKLAREIDTNLSYEFFIEETGSKIKLPMHACRYYVGDKKFTEMSHDKRYAQFKAANKVHQDMTGEMYPKTVYFADEECDLNVPYEFTESEMYQIVTERDPELDRSLVHCGSMLTDTHI